MRQTLSISEAAEVLGVTYSQVYNLVKDETLKAFKARGKWHIYPDSVSEYQTRSNPKSVTEYNGERVFLAWDFARGLGIPYTTYQAYIACGRLKAIKINSRNYITESEKTRFLKRDSELSGRRVVSMDKAAEIAGHCRDWISKKIRTGEIEAIADGVKYHIFLDSLKKVVQQEKKGENLPKERAFLRIPSNGRKRNKKDSEGE